MRAVRSKDTEIEKKIFGELRKRNIRFRRNVSTLLGKPDIASKKLKIAIFIDSCFWHGCRYHCRMPSSNVAYWRAKIDRNKKRDKEVKKWYLKNGWNILRFWEHEIKKDFESCIEKIVKVFDKG